MKKREINIYIDEIIKRFFADCDCGGKQFAFVHNKRFIKTFEVKPVWTKERIHIYGGGSSGYKLSVGNHHLRLNELVSVVNIYNRFFVD